MCTRSIDKHGPSGPHGGSRKNALLIIIGVSPMGIPSVGEVWIPTGPRLSDWQQGFSCFFPYSVQFPREVSLIWWYVVSQMADQTTRLQATNKNIPKFIKKSIGLAMIINLTSAN